MFDKGAINLKTDVTGYLTILPRISQPKFQFKGALLHKQYEIGVKITD
jgi:hypothetical protein